MGLMNKLKNILFEEEEVEIPVIEKKEHKVQAQPKPQYQTSYNNVSPQPVYKPVEQPVYSSFYDDLEPVVKEEKKPVEQVQMPREVVSDREMFKSEKTFNFPAFDEQEFESSIPKPKPKPTNVLEYERRKPDYKKYDIKPEVKKEETKFKPSPIISPVYGILDKNYTPDEITSRTPSSTPGRKLDVDSVRKKAFGLSEKKEVNPRSIIEKVEDEDKRVLQENLNKARTIDELLKDSSDEVIDVENYVEEPTIVEDEVLEHQVNEELTYEPMPSRADKKHEDIDTLIEDIEPNHEINSDDTLESDLFDLIDSMYENREEGE